MKRGNQKLATSGIPFYLLEAEAQAEPSCGRILHSLSPRAPVWAAFWLYCSKRPNAISHGPGLGSGRGKEAHADKPTGILAVESAGAVYFLRYYPALHSPHPMLRSRIRSGFAKSLTLAPPLSRKETRANHLTSPSNTTHLCKSL